MDGVSCGECGCETWVLYPVEAAGTWSITCQRGHRLIPIMSTMISLKLGENRGRPNLRLVK